MSFSRKQRRRKRAQVKKSAKLYVKELKKAGFVLLGQKTFPAMNLSTFLETNSCISGHLAMHQQLKVVSSYPTPRAEQMQRDMWMPAELYEACTQVLRKDRTPAIGKRILQLSDAFAVNEEGFKAVVGMFELERESYTYDVWGSSREA